MSRDKKFVIDSIKMDLFRVVTATGDISKEIPVDSVKTFLDHADKDFGKIELEEREIGLRGKLRELREKLYLLEDPHKRIRWAEDVLTIRCML